MGSAWDTAKTLKVLSIIEALHPDAVPSSYIADRFGVYGNSILTDLKRQGRIVHLAHGWWGLDQTARIPETTPFSVRERRGGPPVYGARGGFKRQTRAESDVARLRGHIIVALDACPGPIPLQILMKRVNAITESVDEMQEILENLALGGCVFAHGHGRWWTKPPDMAPCSACNGTGLVPVGGHPHG